MERLECDVSYQNPEGTVPEEMNFGEYIVYVCVCVWIGGCGHMHIWVLYDVVITPKDRDKNYFHAHVHDWMEPEWQNKNMT